MRPLSPIAAVLPIDPKLSPQGRLAAIYERVRRRTEDIVAPLETEDFVVQPHDDVSPPKWHLAHTTWFFETMALAPYLRGYMVYRPDYAFLFNSYYESLGPRVARVHRGALSRPTVREIRAYRQYIDNAMLDLLHRSDIQDWPALETIVTLALHHEEQHQELLLTDIKAILYANPARPSYLSTLAAPLRGRTPAGFAPLAGGTVTMGAGTGGFAWDNERPRHPVILQDFHLGRRLVTNAEFAAFMDDHGYENPRWWMSDGWDLVRQRSWSAPLYWEKDGGAWNIFTLSGLRRLNPDEPVCHVSFFEADAYARWASARLPTEPEWEHAANTIGNDRFTGNFLEDRRFHPVTAVLGRDGMQMAGDVWEWTQSAYLAYPGYRAPGGPLGEYNGKFMSGQMSLRGGSCVTPRGHYRTTYRNFFQPDKRWQFTGFRLARDGERAP